MSLLARVRDCQFACRAAHNARRMSPPAPLYPPASLHQCAAAALLVRPAAFGYNPQTAVTNRFQLPGRRTQAEARDALAEFDALVAALRAAGLRLCVADDTPAPVKPDALFPNNWLSFHADGSLVLYPLATRNRRQERRPDLIAAACESLGFVVRRRIDLTAQEAQGKFLEGTGSLVLDHRARLAYANRSVRTEDSLVREWCRLMDYEPVLFDAATPDGTPVYHTNVLLWIGESLCGIGSQWIAAADRERVLTRLADSGRTVLDLPERALLRFAGNMLELARPAAAGGGRVLVMSATAADALTPAQHDVLRAGTGQVVVAAVPTIERLGGGSVRCMLAEVPA